MVGRQKIALAICAHHKPYLAMATFVSVLAQDLPGVDLDIHVIFNLGDGVCADKKSYEAYRALANGADAKELIAVSGEIEKRSYGEYDLLARKLGINPKLSPFDDRLRRLCSLNRPNVFYHEYENDQALDSGAWLKFIRTGPWRKYDYVFMIQEGTLLSSRNALSAALEMARQKNIHFLAGAHLKGFVPKNLMLNYNTRNGDPKPVDRFHDRMIAETFEILRRDPDFDALFRKWENDSPALREYHIRDFDNRLPARVLALLDRSRPLPVGRIKWRLAYLLRRLLPVDRPAVERRASLLCAKIEGITGSKIRSKRNPRTERIFVHTEWRPLSDIVDPYVSKDTIFHKDNRIGWFGCGCNHMFSRECLERLHERFQLHNLYEALDLPFSGTALEIMWGFVPAWLGYEKWFFDGFHRITKDPWTLRREDLDSSGTAKHLNRYYFGDIIVRPTEEGFKIDRLSTDLAFMKSVLDKAYF